MTPHERLAGSVDASRPCPGTDRLSGRLPDHREAHGAALRRHRLRTRGIRYQIPAPWRHLREAWVRYARWGPRQRRSGRRPKGRAGCAPSTRWIGAPMPAQNAARSTPAATMAAGTGRRRQRSAAAQAHPRRSGRDPGCRRHGCPIQKTPAAPGTTIRERPHEPRTADPLRPQVEPVRDRRAARQPACHPRRRQLLPQNRSPPRQPGRLRPDHRRARHRKERRAAPARPPPRGAPTGCASRRSPTRPPGSPTSTTRWARSSASP